MKSKLVHLSIDLVTTFAGAYFAMLMAGDSPVTSLWAVLAAGVAGAIHGLNPHDTRYGAGS